MSLKWKLILICFALLLLVSIVYGYKHYADLKERAAIVEKQEEIVKELEKADKEHNDEATRLYCLLAQKEKRETELIKKDAEKQKEMADIVIPDSPAKLVEKLKSRGISARIIRR